MRGTGIAAVAAREVAWIRSDIVALLLLFVVPLLAFGLLAGTFSHAVIRGLHVDVVDADRSATSASIIQAVEAAPGVEVTRRSSDLSSAMHAIRSGEAIAALYIPESFERDVLAGRRPQIVNFFNKQFFTPGNVAASGIQSAVASAAATLGGAPAGGGSYAPGALVVEQYVLNNPALNYIQFLLRAVMPTVLHVAVAIAGAFAVGSEFGPRRDPGDWLRTAGGSPLVALVGKFAPYFAVFALMMVLGLCILHSIFSIPFRGDPIILAAGAVLLVIAYLAIGALLVLLVRNLSVGLSLAGIICSPAFGFAGVGFPLFAMGTFGHVWGALLPLRWYVQILFDQAARGVPARLSVEPLLMLAALTALLFGLAWLRASRVLRDSPEKTEPVQRPVPAGQLGVVQAFRDEYGRVLRDSGAFGLIVMGPLIYAVLYPQPYLGQLIRDVPIAVVDDDRSEISRTIVQALEAHEGVSVVARPLNLREAQEAVGRREVFGILSIPEGTQREVLKGQPARLPAFVDSAYFLLYNRTLQGISEAVGTVSAELRTGPARPEGNLYRAALARGSPVEFLSEPLFNPTGAYGAYVVPAAFILILQQSMLMGIATLGGVAREQGAAMRRRRGRPAAVVGQALAHLALALPSYALYLVVLPHLYGYVGNPRVFDLLVIVIPFVLAISFLGQFAGALARRRETAVILLMAIGMPLFFLVGVAWPPEAIPEGLRIASAAIPSTFGIDALLRINQMSASVADVWRDWASLWLLAAGFALLACLAARRGSRAEPLP